MTEKILTQDRLRSLLDYDPETGVFTRPNGKAAGTVRPDGYKKITLGGVQYYAHRLAWLYVHGVSPDVIDHIDRNPSNNAIHNLRSVTHAENMQNASPRCDNTSGHRGVIYFKRTRRWRANICLAGKNHSLGYYATAGEAREAYQKAAALMHPYRLGD
jgi:hypothetical protein